jgi:fibrillarin-like pre-rRNA processing protein
LSISLSEIFPNVFKARQGNLEYLATKNLTPGRTYYGEPTFTVDGVEYRSWNPTRSKLAAAIMKGVSEMPIGPGSNNVSPILGDARRPEEYSALVPRVDVVFADVAQPDQAEIVAKNARWFLRKGGSVMLSIKSRSIDVVEKPQEVYRAQVKILEESGLRVGQLIDLEPYEKDHAMALAESP